MQTTKDLQECIATCRQCHDVCIQTLNHCIEKGDRHVQPAHIRLLLDCIDICETSADFMSRGSDVHHVVCSACAEVCEWCGADCDRLADDEQMRTCAEICHRCAQTCRAMASMANNNHHLAQEGPRHEDIAALAEKLCEEDGRPEGKDQEYWFRAEQTLRERQPAHAAGTHAS